MKFFAFNTTLFASTASLLLLGLNSSAQDFSPTDLAAYYSSQSGSYLKPAMITTAEKDTPSLSFRKGENDTFIPVGDLEYDPEYTQNLFELDANQYIKAMGASDLLDAKIKYYSKLSFNNKTQRHERPYTYLSGWMSLNHPPLKKITLPLGNYTKTFSESALRPQTSTYFTADFQNKIDAESNTELTFGNKTHTLFNGNSIKEKIRLVKDAKRYLFGSVMAISCDPSSEEFVQALVDKAQSGVKVTLIMERFYMSTIFKHCANRLRDGGVDVVLVFDQLKPKTYLTFFHAKFWVRDGEEAIVGGQNIIKYESNSTGYNELNRDSDLLIQGPAATDFSKEYLDLWADHATRHNESLESFRVEIAQAKEAQRMAGVRGNQSYEEKLGNPATRMKGVCRVLVQHAYDRNLSIAAVLTHHLEAAKQSIILTSPEIEFDVQNQKDGEQDKFYQAAKNAAARGVGVDLILNGVDGGDGEFTSAVRGAMNRAKRNDMPLRYHFWHHELAKSTAKSAREHRKYLLELEKTPGFHAWTHFNYMHAKQAYFDRIVTSISSMNLDKASLQRNYEAGAVCMDENLANEMEDQLTLDLVNSVPVVSSNEISDEISDEPEQSSLDLE